MNSATFASERKFWDYLLFRNPDIFAAQEPKHFSTVEFSPLQLGVSQI